MKKLDLLVVILILIIGVSFISFKPDKRINKFEQELIEKENWLISELDDISNYLDFEVSDYRYSNRKVFFNSRYVSPEYDEEKLEGLQNHLIEKGWVDITNKVDKDEYILQTASESDETAKYVHILCNKRATIFMYMTDMQNDYVIDLFKARTLVHLRYDYTLPCYELVEW